MTDGIIQKIFRVAKSDVRNERIGITELEHLDLIESELIEKIKQEIEFGCMHSYGCCKDCHDIEISLIGDIQ